METDDRRWSAQKCIDGITGSRPGAIGRALEHGRVIAEAVDCSVGRIESCRTTKILKCNPAASVARTVARAHRSIPRSRKMVLSYVLVHVHRRRKLADVAGAG